MNHEAVYAHIKHAFTNEAPFCHHLGMVIHTLTASESIATVNMKPTLIGNYARGILHGGVVASLIDNAMGVLAIAQTIGKMPEPLSMEEVLKLATRTATIDMRVDFLMPGQGESFSAHAQVLHGGKTIATLQAQVFDHHKNVIAVGIGKFKSS